MQMLSTQAVSQMTGPAVVSLADDLLQTQRMTMTIDGLIESTEWRFESKVICQV